MSYTDKIIADVLASVKKIGIVKTSKLFNISTSTIYKWMDKNLTSDKQIISEKINSKKFVLRRVSLKNDSINCYIYNLKDLRNGMEFNSIAYNNNYQTPVIFLKYILNSYFKKTEIKSLQILLKGFYHLKKFDKFKDIFKDIKAEILITNEHFSIDSFDNKKILSITDKNFLFEYLTKEQLFYNINLEGHEHINLTLCQPIFLDEFSDTDFSKNKELFNLSLTLDKLFHKTRILLREADFIQVKKNLEVIRVILKKKSTDQKLKLQYLNLKVKYFELQGDYNKSLDFLEKKYNKIGENHHELKFFLLLKICKIYLKSYNIKKFDYYFAKITVVDFNNFLKDSIFEFHLLMIKRKSLYLPVQESINSYQEILDKHQKFISQKKLFDIYIKICNLYRDISNFKEAHNYLDKAHNLSVIQHDKYLLCEYYEFKCRCFMDQGLFGESIEYCNNLEMLSKENNYNSYYFLSKGLKALNYLENNKFDLAKIEIDKFLYYGKSTNNMIMIYRANVLLQLYYGKIRDNEKALRINKEQIKICRNLNDLTYEVDAVLNTCIILSRLPDKNEMLVYVEKYEELNKLLKDPGAKIRILTLKACYYQFKKELKLALDNYKKALNLAKENKSYNLISIIYSHIAIIQREMEEYKSAVFSINESIYYYKLVGSKFDLPRLIFIKAKTYFAAKNFTKAKTFLAESIDLLKDNSNNSLLAQCLELEEHILKQNV